MVIFSSFAFVNKCLVGSYLIKFDKGSARTCEICLKFNNNDTRTTSLTFNRFYSLFYCFYSWLWTSKCWLGETVIFLLLLFKRIVQFFFLFVIKLVALKNIKIYFYVAFFIYITNWETKYDSWYIWLALGQKNTWSPVKILGFIPLMFEVR